MKVAGNFTQYSGNAYNFCATGTHEVILDGDEPQIVTFASTNSKFSRLYLAQNQDEYIFMPQDRTSFCDTMEDEPYQNPGAASIVLLVSISPKNITVHPGEDQLFTAKVYGINNPSQKVKWTVFGNESESTAISQDGLLTVGADETAQTLKVVATSEQDSEKTKAVEIKTCEPIVSNVMVFPEKVSLRQGESYPFCVTVFGGEKPSQNVHWYLDGNTSEETKISDKGIVELGADEQAEEIIVTAKSDVDETKFGCAVVSVNHSQNESPSITGSMSQTAVRPGRTATITVKLKDYKPNVQDIASLYIEVPGVMADCAVVSNSEKALLENSEISQNGNLYFVYMPEEIENNQIPEGSENLFSFKICISNHLTENTDIILPIKVTAGNSKEDFLFENETVNITIPVRTDFGITGDINDNNDLDILDAHIGKRIAMKDPEVVYTEIGFNAGDLNGDGKITINEVRKIKRVIMHQDTFDHDN